MTQWWSCPRCSRRLKFAADRVWCERTGCRYDKQLPTVVIPVDLPPRR